MSVNEQLDRYGPAVRTMFAAKGKPLTDQELRDLFDPETPTPDLDEEYREMLYPGLNAATREAAGVVVNAGRLVATMLVFILLMLIAIGLLLWLKP